MALVSPQLNGLGSGSYGSSLQEQIARLMALSQALQQQGGFGAQPMQQGGMGQPQPSAYQPNVAPMQPGAMPMGGGQGRGGMDMMSSLLPMIMMMGGGGGLGRSGGMQPGMVGTIPGIY